MARQEKERRIMIAKRKAFLRQALQVAALSLFVLPLTGRAGAMYMPDGTKPDGAGGYMNPNDGVCVIGVKPDGTMKIDASITNFRDCAAYTTGLTGMTTQAQCIVANGVSPNDGYRHAWATSNTCVNAANPAVAISLVDLDRTLDMCKSKGGTALSANAICTAANTPYACCTGAGAGTCGTCVAYGWVYMNRKLDGSLPVSGSGVYTTSGTQASDNLGFCYTSIKLSGAGGDGTYTSTTTCPSAYNATTNSLCTAAGTPFPCCTGSGTGTCTAAGNNLLCTAAGTPLACCTGAGTGTCTWSACGSNPDGCQTQAQYDAGLQWSYSTSAPVGCRYLYGVKGRIPAAVTKADGTTWAANTLVDLTTAAYDTQGECLAAGFSWDNWLPNMPTNSLCTAAATPWTCCTGAGAGTCIGNTTKTSASGGDYAGMPSANVGCVAAGNPDPCCTGANTGTCGNTALVKLDATTAVKDGGGNFYSGTGAICTKCHTDQSRQYAERTKPGYVETRHKYAGNSMGPWQANFTAATSPWGLTGVQCNMCHSTARPAQDDLIQVNPAGLGQNGLCTAARAPWSCCTGAGTGTCDSSSVCTAAGVPWSCCTGAGTGTCPGAGAPVSATGHNKTEEGGHVTDVCFNCHGNFPSANPAYVIPTSGGDFALTGKGLAPIANQFLNSPHAMYVGTTSNKVDIGNANLFKSNNRHCTAANTPDPCCTGPGTGTCSTFLGYICRTSQTQSYCIGAGNPSVCCTGAGTGCGASGSGILSTVYRNGAVEEIPSLDLTSNPACTNAGNGSAASGAAGFWVPDGDVVSGGTPGDTAQGSCMTCHDMHWGLADSNSKAEPFKRECTTCHSHPAGEASASGAPQINLATINHLKTKGTPLENWTTDPTEACETCHMPLSAPGSSPMHLWRINTDPTYKTMGASQANIAADGSYANAAWVDLDHACGQCHGADSGPAKPGVPYFTTAALSRVAKGMHNAAGVNYAMTFTMSNSPGTLTVNVSASVNCGGPCPGLTYAWDWGDGGTGSGSPTSHTYTAGGTKTVSLTATLTASGKKVGSVSRSITLQNPDLPPTVAGTCTWRANSWQMEVADSSSDDGPDADTVPPDGNPTLQIVIDWGDGSTKSFGGQGATLTHVYSVPGSYTVTQTAIDSKLQSASTLCSTAATPAYFTISGTVKNKLGTAGLPSAAVTLRRGASTVKTVYANVSGQFAAGALKPGTYTLSVSKGGYAFDTPAATVTVGPSNPLPGSPEELVINATAP
jgi:hypothetical protein